MDGKPIYPEYSERVHVSEEPLVYNPGYTLFVGVDFGLTPAAVFAQKSPSGQWRILDELVTEDMGASKFARELRHKLGRDFPDADIEVWGDPAGMQRSQADETTPFDMMNAHGVPAMPTHTNDPVVRRDAVGRLMLMLDFSGDPAYVMDKKCKMLRKGKAGGYKYKRKLIAGDERYHDVPDKNIYSHVSDAEQYLMVGAGEDLAVLQASSTRRPSILRAIR